MRNRSKVSPGGDGVHFVRPYFSYGEVTEAGCGDGGECVRCHETEIPQEKLAILLTCGQPRSLAYVQGQEQEDRRS